MTICVVNESLGPKEMTLELQLDTESADGQELVVQEEIDVANETELYELIAIARSQLPAELTQGGAPPLGFVFDSVPQETPEERGEKRKRIMIDDLEMEGGVGGHVNVMRNVRTLSHDTYMLGA